MPWLTGNRLTCPRPAARRIRGWPPGYATRGTPAAGVRAFRDRLAALGVNATVRDNRGTDIDAACGQLAAGAGTAPPQLVSASATRESPYHVHRRP